MTGGADPQELKVLIVDDSAATRLVLEKMLAEMGRECESAADGLEAWERFQRGGIDVVISDWTMPRLSGDELCRRIRSSEGDYAYVILLTSLGDREHVQAGMEAGADDYLSKPPDIHDLAARLTAASRVIALHRRLSQQQEELERLNREFSEQARHDPMTGLGNRLRLEEDLADLDARLDRYGETYALALFDIDHFKAYNDHFGHAEGDVVLRSVAETLSTTLRKGDSSYRFGGEELLFVIHRQDLEQACIAADRMRARVEELGIEHAPDAPDRALTVSAGVAVRDREAASWQDALRTADKALYAAKDAGRNRVVARGG